LFFFFQAEDGIRYFHVTGVQTCALPISPRTALLSAFQYCTATGWSSPYRAWSCSIAAASTGVPASAPAAMETGSEGNRNRTANRSEERRAGEAGSIRVSGAH